ncbi:uncharacterized protein [Chelonus insularis]|uniref:uncharacterized protein n=1 Tax=Chelonus insularis TaxID=460826 RepID=UPI00158BEEE8|nr:uncharacterized protein LOC118064901 [Chelonus insularis]
MEKTRYKGKFIKKKTLERNLKAVEILNKGKLKKQIRNLTYSNREAEHPKVISSSMKHGLCEGIRFIDLQVLSENLQCEKCGQLLHLKNATEEKLVGQRVNLLVTCTECQAVKEVYTTKSHLSSDKKTMKSDVNTRLILGAIHSGIGCTALNKMLACMNCPIIYPALYKKFEREVGLAIEKTAKNSCKEAAEEERRLVVENITKLCEELPDEVVKEVYPQLYKLDRDPSMSSEDHTEEFDVAVDNIVNIIVSYDMAWSKRGAGNSYDSFNGYGAIIGFLSKKIIDYGTRNRKCRQCGKNADKKHDCRKNFQGSAKAMEADLGSALVNDSSILKEANVNVRVLIGDEDSATISSVRKNSAHSIVKFADYNHLRKHFVSDLYSLKNKYREMAHKSVIPHLKKCFGYAVAQNKGQTAKLASTLRSIPDHVYGRHENCDSWCHRDSADSNNNTESQTILLHNPELFKELSTIFQKYANNASKFSTGASSQSNESFHNMVAHKNPKKDCHSLSEASDFRIASAVCTKNEGNLYLSKVEKQLNMSPGKRTASFSSQLDEKRLKRAKTASLPKTKLRRVHLRQQRVDLRKKNEKSEGTMYESNCGLELSNDLSAENNINEEDERSPCLLKTVNEYNIIYFDLETSGFGRSADILQIAAVGQESVFSTYVNPSQPVTVSASAVTGLENIHGELFLHGKKVSSIPIHQALLEFKNYLASLSTPILLVAHKVTFDSHFLVRAIQKHSLISEFESVIIGFSDSLNIFKTKYPDRKGPGVFKLSALANDFLPENSNENFHDAVYDANVLQQLSSLLISKTEFFDTAVSFRATLQSIMRLQNENCLKKTLQPLQNIISSGMIKKISQAGIDYNKLKKIYLQDGENAIIDLLSKKIEMGQLWLLRIKKF